MVSGLLGEFGWPAGAIHDLGHIAGARSTEMYSRLFFTVAGCLVNPEFNIGLKTG